MKHLRKSLIVLAAIGLLVVLLGMQDVTAGKADCCKVTSAAANRGLNFSHGLHVTENGVACADCHAAATTSMSGEDDLLPSHSECATCHSVDDRNECAKCHLDANPVASPRLIDYSPKFSHAAHVADAELDCAVCHADLDGQVCVSSPGHFPKMADCMQCHNEKLVANDCRRCHGPYDELRPRDHTLDWVRLHGLKVADDQEECNLCHTPLSVAGDCQSCHAGEELVQPRAHPRNYVFRHGHDAQLADLRCATCHEQRDFCTECHRGMNVLPAGHYRPGWVTASGGTHGEEAEFDLESCMSCHDRPAESPVCATCHTE